MRWSKDWKAARAGAFTLVEVTLALGIAACSFVSILALVPIGLDHFRGALATSTRAQIVQRVVSAAQQTDATELLAAGTVLKHFDDEGFELPGPAGAIYTVSMTATSPTVLPGSAPSANILTLTVRVADNPAGLADPFAASSRAPITDYVAYVSRVR
jgi:uncharacterized protein (TIGR02598 family)